MRWQLDDNERGAFNYLFGGAVLVLVVRGILYAVDKAGAPATTEPAGLDLYQHGYLLGRDGLTVVQTAAGRMERIAFAVLASLGGAVVLAALGAAIARGIGRPSARWALGVGRSALVVLLGWSMYAALFVPVRSARLEEGALVLRTYRLAVRDIPVPFTAEEQRLTQTDISLIEAVTEDPVHGCDGRIVIHAVGHEGQATTLSRRNGLCATQQVEALREASELAATLERGLH